MGLPSPPDDTGGQVGTDSNAGTDSDTGSDSATDTAPDTAPDTDTGTVSPWAGDDDTVSPLLGIDVSHWNGSINWPDAWNDGVTFAVAKATESDYYTSPTFPDEYDGSYDVGMIRGAYHFAIPDDSDGATQATFFVENGGDWTPDGHTLPGMLDIEYNPYGNTCYDLSKTEMIAWIRAFDETYIALTGRAPLVYSNADWWNTCVGTSDLPGINPLWVAYWGSSPPTLPGGWSEYTFWQFTSEGSVDGISGNVDLDAFPGTMHDLRSFALDE